jgi:hypothetical protein
MRNSLHMIQLTRINRSINIVSRIIPTASRKDSATERNTITASRESTTRDQLVIDSIAKRYAHTLVLQPNFHYSSRNRTQ